MKSKYTVTKLACYIGYIVQAIINNFLPILFIALQDVYGLGYEKLARLMVFNFVTQMIVDIITPKIVDKIGYKKTVVLCHGAAALGLVLLGILPNIIPIPFKISVQMLSSISACNIASPPSPGSIFGI